MLVKMISRTLLFICSITFCLPDKLEAQLPQPNLIYINFGPMVVGGSLTPPTDSMFIYNPSLPVNAANPVLNSILMPDASAGLAISKVLGSTNNTPTFYTTVNLKYWYYDPVTNLWVNTNHSTGPANTVNIGAGGGFIYSMQPLGNFPSVYRYDGTGDAVYLGNIPFSPRPFDMAVDCEGNFYVISLIGPVWHMTKHNSSGTMVQVYNVSNPNIWSFSGGLAIIGNNLYADIGSTGGIAHGIISGTTLTFNSTTPPVPFTQSGHAIGDFAAFPFDPSGNLPTLSVSASDTVICNGAVVSFTSNATGSNVPQFQWKVNGVSVAGAANDTFSYSPADGDAVTCQMISNGGCSDITVISPPITIHVQPAPSASFTLAPQACKDDTVVVMADTPLNISYQWNFDGATIVNGTGPGPYELVWNNAGNHTVTLTAGQGNCATSASKNINVFNNPTLNLVTENSTVCINDTIKLFVSTEAGNHLQWLTDNSFILLDTMGNTASIVPLQPCSVFVKATNIAGCSIAKGFGINIAENCCVLSMPNVFSPNDDRLNDKFEPVGNHFNIESFKIFNRWGQIVYAAFKNHDGWDGTYNGKPQDMGTYFYALYYRCDNNKEVIYKKGDLILLR